MTENNKRIEYGNYKLNTTENYNKSFKRKKNNSIELNYLPLNEQINNPLNEQIGNYIPNKNILYNQLYDYNNSLNNISNMNLFNNEFDSYLNITNQIRSNSPKFLLNLFRILSYNTCKSICWNSEGSGFIILDKKLFMDEVSPFITKSKDISGFIRQLSNYEFLKSKKFLLESNKDEYSSPYLKRGRPDLLVNGSKSNINNQIQTCNNNSINNTNREIFIKLKLLEETNFELQKHVMNLEKKNKHQDLIIEKMACFMSKIYFSKIDINSLNSSDLNIFRNLCTRFPNFEHEIKNKKDILHKLTDSSISEIFEEVEKLEGINFMKEGGIKNQLNNSTFEDLEFLKE